MTEPFLLDLIAKSTAVFVVALAAAWLGRRASAATRHLIWTSAFAGVLLLPALALLPGWRLPSTAPWPTGGPTGDGDHGILVSKAPTPDMITPGTPDAAVASTVVPGPEGAVARLEVARPKTAETPSSTTPMSATTVLLAMWLVGSSLLLLLTACALLGLRRLARRSQPVLAGPVHELATRLLAECGIRRPVRVLMSSERKMPMTWGLLRPVLLLPAEATTWTTDRLRMVMLHELGHIVRWDAGTLLLGQLTRCFYWFHPLAWLAFARLRQDQEKSCDDFVLGHGAAPEDYAEHLVAVTAQLPAGCYAPSLALGMARASRLRDRVAALLDRTRRRTPLGVVQRLSLVMVALLVAGAVASARWVEPPKGLPAPVFIEVDDDPAPMTPETLKRLEEIRKKLRDHFDGPLDDKALTEAAIRGLLKGLNDPYTDYLPAASLNALESQMTGTLVGIGAQLRLVGDRIAVVTPLDNSPALKAGIRPGDLIEAIDGESTRGMKLQDAVNKIIGKSGAVVKLKIVRDDGAVEELAITRGPIRIGSVQGFDRSATGDWRHLIDGQHKIGYVRIMQFSGETAKEVRAAVESLQKEGLKGLVLDLRFCPGGQLGQALDVCKMLVREGELLTLKRGGKLVNSFKADGKNTVGDFPLVVLVNEQTASAAELTAGVLRDRERALVLGTRTFGKGSVQSLVKLDDGALLKVTSSYYYLPSGQMIHKRPGEANWGVDPNDGYYVPLTQAQSEALLKSFMERATLGHPKGTAPTGPERLTPKLIEERYGDPQLAAAQRTLVAKLTGGEFIKVGQSTAALESHLQRIEEMRRRRDDLLQNLRQLEKEIDAAQQAGKK